MKKLLKRVLTLTLAAALALGGMMDAALSDTQSSAEVNVPITRANPEPALQEKTVTFYANFPGDENDLEKYPENRTLSVTLKCKEGETLEIPYLSRTNEFKWLNQSLLECCGWNPDPNAAKEDGATKNGGDKVRYEDLADAYYALWKYDDPGAYTQFSPGWPEKSYPNNAHPYPNKADCPAIRWSKDGSGYYLTLPTPDGGWGFANYCVRAGYEFIGWSYHRNGENLMAAGTVIRPVKGDLYAVYRKDVTFHANLMVGAEPEAQTVATYYRGGDDDKNYSNGYALTFPELPEAFRQPGYQFLGWSLAADGSGKIYKPGEKAVLRGESGYYAVWKANPAANYTVEYYQDDERSPFKTEVKSGPAESRIDVDALAKAACPEGYRFVDFVPAGPIIRENGQTLVLIYYKRALSVSYRYEEGSVPLGAPAAPVAVNDLLAGENVKIDGGDYEVDGFIWSGWKVASPEGLTIENGGFAMPDGDVVLTGGWTAKNADKIGVEPIDGVYTGKEHTMKVSGVAKGDTVEMRVRGGGWQSVPELAFRNAVQTTVDVKVTRAGLAIFEAPGVAVSIRRRALSFEIENAAYEYDAVPHSLGIRDVTPSGEGNGLVGRESITVNPDAAYTQTYVTGGPVAVGADAALPYTVAENTLLDNYDITVIPGSIEITRRPVTLTAPSGTFNYSAAEHALLIDKVTSPKNMGFLADVGEVRVQFATLADGTPSNTRRVPGTQSVTLDPASVTLVPAEGFESVDLPAQYEITLEPGLLTVNAKAGAVGLTLRALDAAAMYDGAPHAVLPADTSAYTVEGLPDGVELSGIGAAAEGTKAGKYEIVFVGAPVLMDTSTTPATDVSACFKVNMKNAALTIGRRPVRLIIGSVSHVYDGSEYRTAWAAGEVADETGARIGGLAATDAVSAALRGNGRTDVGTSKVSFDKKKTVIMNGTEDVTASYDVREWGEGSIEILPADTGYVIRYYYNGVLDEGATATGVGKMGDVITAYAAKGRGGMRFEGVTGLPLTLGADASGNVVSVYYVTQPETQLIVEVDTPLAGSMMSVTVGDAVE